MRYSIVKPNTYQDSLRLMQLSNTLDDADGVDRVSIMMGTSANREILRGAGLDTADLDGAGPTDLVIVADVADAAAGERLVAKVDEFLTHRAPAAGGSRLRSARSLERAVDIVGGANLAIVSIPGEFVASEVHRLLDRKIHAFVFSDNVSISDELALKRRARECGLLVMGPDCGTGLVRGLPLAFANVVHEGRIGLVGASGTGLQEVMAHIDRLGGGVSHAIGLGGRDLSAEVGGITCLQALRALDTDVGTDVVVLVGKPPAARVREEVLGVAGALSKPVVAMLLGERTEADVAADICYPRTLEEAARVAVELAGTRSSRRIALRPEQRWIKALYTGGTLAAEAAALLGDSLGPAGDADRRAGFLFRSDGHEVIDLGDDVYTRGRPHPMIDPAVRTARIAAVMDDPENAVLLLDVVLGHGAHPDPAGVLAAVIGDGLAGLHARGRDLAVVASVCGTEGDPQSASAQTRTLERAGVAVLPSNAAAVRYAVAILRRRGASPVATSATPEPIRRLLAEPPRIVNIGLRGFAENLLQMGAQVVQYDWRPVAGGDRRLQSLIDALS
ncbi:acyl-CoA synthetase FdrA [Pseudonocardia bannensis]|uniref:Acyl-CoA synthetase FdrA n=1 Tax=Pseudonocardia bannensis TaxID=630973 RepID=A0A848DQQ8_9PSEU|nr:acyl-CoA synthetase FdrA [Pseudonocardia bannensis]NMH94644.1 acyl-CoA synthetase FdrA [Pseudonocardia bannensis]